MIVCATNETESETQKIQFITMVGDFNRTNWELQLRVFQYFRSNKLSLATHFDQI